MNNYDNLELNFDDPIFPEEVTQEMIAQRLIEEFPGRWKSVRTAQVLVSQTLIDLGIRPKRRDFVTELSDGTQVKRYIYDEDSAMAAYNRIMENSRKPKKEKKSEAETKRMHIAFEEGEIHLRDSTALGKEAMRIIEEETARTGKKMAIVAAEMIIGYRNDHPIELTEEDKLRIEIKKLKNELKKYQKGENT